MKENLQSLWAEVLAQIQGTMGRPTFDSFLRDTEPLAALGDHLVVKVANAWAKNTLNDIYKPQLETLLMEISGKRWQLLLVQSADEMGELQEEKSPVAKVSDTFSKRMGLLEGNTFDTFVVGKSNQFAQSVSIAIAEKMAHNLHCKKDYNPLYIHGGSGLGKTHLMHAVAWHILDSQPYVSILYVSCESFLNEYVQAIRNNTMPKFQEKYRNCDILLIDDVQFLANKEGFQEELFHTFNELYSKERQIILTSDCKPSEINNLDERLKTRFSQGVVTDINPPDLETRIAILRQKAKFEAMDVPDDVTLYIAENVKSNIRELEGALKNVYAFACMGDLPVTLEMAKDRLSILGATGARQKLDLNTIQEAVCELYGVSKSDLFSKKRNRDIAFPRQVAMYVARELTDLSYPKIGEFFGGRDHSTVMHGVAAVEKAMEKDPVFKLTINNLKAQLSE